jgi:hypothetical protein
MDYLQQILKPSELQGLSAEEIEKAGWKSYIEHEIPHWYRGIEWFLADIESETKPKMMTTDGLFQGDPEPEPEKSKCSDIAPDKLNLDELSFAAGTADGVDKAAAAILETAAGIAASLTNAGLAVDRPKTRHIYVTFKKAGIHQYPAAGTEPALAEAEYLQFRHRHLFGFRVQIEVFHDDRELEFHCFLNFVQGFYEQGTLKLDNMSCEMISDQLAEKIIERYPNRGLVIEINEDEECGSVCYY